MKRQTILLLRLQKPHHTVVRIIFQTLRLGSVYSFLRIILLLPMDLLKKSQILNSLSLFPAYLFNLYFHICNIKWCSSCLQFPSSSKEILSIFHWYFYTLCKVYFAYYKIQHFNIWFSGSDSCTTITIIQFRRIFFHSKRKSHAY